MKVAFQFQQKVYLFVFKLNDKNDKRQKQNDSQNVNWQK